MLNYSKGGEQKAFNWRPRAEKETARDWKIEFVMARKGMKDRNRRDERFGAGIRERREAIKG